MDQDDKAKALLLNLPDFPASNGSTLSAFQHFQIETHRLSHHVPSFCKRLHHQSEFDRSKNLDALFEWHAHSPELPLSCEAPKSQILTDPGIPAPAWDTALPQQYHFFAAAPGHQLEWQKSEHQLHA